IEELEEENRKLKGTGKKLKGIIFKEDKKSDEENKRGAVSGHRAFFRNKPKPQEVTEEKDVLLKRCPNCNGALSEMDFNKWNERYGIDIPLPIKPIITKYNVAQYHCKVCGKWSQGQPANLFGKSPFGINIIMLVLHLKYRGRAVDEHIRESLKFWYGIDLSGGGVHGILNRATELFGASYEAIKQNIRDGKVVYADETGWRVEGENWYAWAFVNDKVSLYTIENTRGGGIPQKILDGFKGVLSTDWYQAYNSVDCEKQKCGVHFLRQTHTLATEENATEEVKTFHSNMVWFLQRTRKKHKKCKTIEERLKLHDTMIKAL
ncbi:MAG: transposase, partial [Nanoarchaeota archaeon]